ncbi:MAG TPA: methylenetetrahydrofolate reductase, partial [Candidatus Marinimicrobia bacterium]|nr:methylenetetrahydrofolate reductase [Candidatus Neomarinimicrobiota bacterium]
MKISEKIANYKAQGKTFYSFEFFPPKTDYGLDNLYSRIDRMASFQPAYIDITWGAGGSTADKTLGMCKTIQKYFGLEVMMHLTCTNMPVSSIKKVLTEAKENGLSNILALRGDPPDGSSSWKQHGFRCGADLVRYIRKGFGNYFFLGVGGYPDGHHEQSDLDIDISFLKEKVDAGSDIVVTQLFYDVDKFLFFRDKCIKSNIKVPIIPGIMPIHNYARFLKFTQFCQVSIPDSVSTQLESIKNDDSSVINYGIDQAAEMCQKLIENGVPGLHFYTLNLEHSVSAILKSLGFVSSRIRELPWRQSASDDRKTSEDVRPIYWSNRPVSYLTRTENWDDFPNGRWGDIASPSFGELNQYHAIRAGSKSDKVKARRKKMWGEPKSIKDITDVFVSFCKGKINSLPWCEIPLAIESQQISSDLINFNELGFFTINSQPKVNGAPSEDVEVGWGGPGGRVYQKAYLEFFTSRDKLDGLLKSMESTDNISYQAINVDGDLITNLLENSVMAVTWGIFPGKEVIQPTIVDVRSFLIWKDEAFSLWIDDWASIYKAKSESYV